MAHRKPLGTTCRVVADWEGETPYLLDCLVTPAGTWYRIIGVEEKANPKKLGLLLERISPRTVIEVNEDDLIRWETEEGGRRGRVHPFTWYPRDRKRAA